MGKRDAAYGHAALASSRAVLRRMTEDPRPLLRCVIRVATQRVAAAAAAFHAAVCMASLRITRVNSSWITTRADRPTHIGDTTPPCHVAHASVAGPEVSIAHISGDKALVLCQEGSPSTPRAFSSRRRRGSSLYLGRVTPVSTAVRRGTAPGRIEHGLEGGAPDHRLVQDQLLLVFEHAGTGADDGHDPARYGDMPRASLVCPARHNGAA